MGLQSCLVKVKGYWFGTLCALTCLPHPTVTWLSEGRGQWRIRQKNERRQNTPSCPPLIILYPRRSRPLVCLDQRLRCFSKSSVVDSRMSRESPLPTSISYRAYWLQSNEETQQQYWAHHRLLILTLSIHSDSYPTCGTPSGTLYNTLLVCLC